jgi:hypothetical protein
MIPWDFDHSWDTDIYTDDDEYWKQVLDPRFFQGHSVGHPSTYHRFPDCIIAFQNRVRELSDLLVNSDQCGQIIDECAAVISDPAGVSFVEADRALWDHHPRNTSPGTYYQSSPTGDFAGMVERMREFISPGGWGAGNLARIDDDAAIPNTPVVASRSPAGFPADALEFGVGAFSDPQGHQTFGGMKWRIAEVSPGARVEQPAPAVVLVPDGAEWKYLKGRQEPSAGSGAWRRRGFDDSAWSVGRTAIGYGEDFVATELSDMRGGYTTLYLRRTFDVMNTAEMGDLILEVKYDDGVNLWINEQLVYQDNVSAAELAHDATADSAIENVSFVRYELGDPGSLLVEGTNVIAVQVLNQSISGSSDCFIDVRLTAKPVQEGPDETPVESGEGRGKYEIDAVWESEELSAFSDHIAIPASVVRPGGTYRVRCRMKDTTGRWSHWSVPIQFTAGEPIGGSLRDLRITELMYNPAEGPDGAGMDNNEYEFIELKNVGEQTLDLSGVSLTDGVTFDFAGSAIATLGPGEFVLVVRNEVAFLSRYGVDLASVIAGEYDGRLDNGGERIKLIDFWGGTIAEFEYSDGGGWPAEADGAGYSLVLVDAANGTEPGGSLSDPVSWRASTHIGGSPGADDP